MARSGQLQIRVTRAQKARLRRLARAADSTMSEWVLRQALPEEHTEWAGLLERLAQDPAHEAHHLAALHDWLVSLAPAELVNAVAEPPAERLSAFVRAYLAALVEQAAERVHREAPGWTASVAPLTEPYFASRLVSLRAHLLSKSPPPFRRRNLFVDTGLTGRV